VTSHLDRHGVPRHSEQTAWDAPVSPNERRARDRCAAETSTHSTGRSNE
jgi:hypothetical protein